MTANDVDARPAMWRRFDDNDLAAFDALPEPIRRRRQQHSYDPWAVNALMLRRTFWRKHALSRRAIVTLPHVAAEASVLRYGSIRRACADASFPPTLSTDGPTRVGEQGMP